MSLVKIKHVVKPNKEQADALFAELMSILAIVYSTVEEQAIAVAPIKQKYDKFLADLARESFMKGKKMFNADYKDNKMYATPS